MNAKLFFVSFLFLSLNAISQTNTSLTAVDFKTQAGRDGTQILDVRSAGEYQSGHIQYALLANWNNRGEFMNRIKYVDKTKPVYVYCLSGARSAAAAKWMRENGYNQVYELQGGINAWKIASFPVEGAPNIKQMTMAEYESQVGTNGIVLVDVGAEWCPPCKKMEPVIQQLQKDDGSKFKLIKVDASVQTELIRSLHAEEIPVYIIYKNGKEVWRASGLTPIDQFKKQIASN